VLEERKIDFQPEPTLRMCNCPPLGPKSTTAQPSTSSLGCTSCEKAQMTDPVLGSQGLKLHIPCN
jgi:hypothetical protein